MDPNRDPSLLVASSSSVSGAQAEDTDRVHRFFYPESSSISISRSKVSPQWQITVIRGADVKVEVVETSEEEVKTENK